MQILKREKKFRAAPPVRKVTGDWESEKFLFIVIMRRGTAINSEACMNVLQKLHSQIPHRRMEDALLLHDNAARESWRQSYDVITKTTDPL
jgi:hypothetical protein